VFNHGALLVPDATVFGWGHKLALAYWLFVVFGEPSSIKLRRRPADHLRTRII
jgi:hypothetical protein